MNYIRAVVDYVRNLMKPERTFMSSGFIMMDDGVCHEYYPEFCDTEGYEELKQFFEFFKNIPQDTTPDNLDDYMMKNIRSNMHGFSYTHIRDHGDAPMRCQRDLNECQSFMKNFTFNEYFKQPDLDKPSYRFMIHKFPQENKVKVCIMWYQERELATIRTNLINYL